ncbi:carbon-nitrogen family hydrolase [Paenibacillus sp. JSM ZJ436]|uniref:carbon-nitrogen family hydrolase n=1 Tax=Paenibacillus sp. JSM ZJ436 TaxID=3376190 RepID=UPI00379A63AB
MRILQHTTKGVFSVNIALIQADIQIGEPTANFQHIKKLMETALSEGQKPDILVLPEMWNTGYALERIHELADPDGRQARELLSSFAKRHQVHIVGGSVAEKKNGQIYNTMYVYDAAGEQKAMYSKIHLFRLMDEEKHLSAGDQAVVFDLQPGFTAGASICYDVRFPELSRTLALKGAQVLFVPAEWPNPRLHHWRTLLTARAIENQMYVVACNRVGTSGDTSFFGHSMIIDPWGDIVVEGSEEEGILRGALNPALTDEVRTRIPVFEDRRPGLYKLS